MKFCGHICVNRESRESGALAVEEAAKRLGEGSDVLFFPEGTRSPGNEMGPFQAGAFAVAAHQGLPVLPVAIFCSRPVLKRGTPWYLIPNRPVELKLSPMGEVGAQEDESISSFARRVQSQLQTKLQDPPTSLLTS